MTTVPMQRQYTRPLLIDQMDDAGTARVLDRVKHVRSEDAFDEGWLQRLIFRFPQVLPIRDIEPAFASVVPVCTELPTPAGRADNLYVSTEGDLVLVECKLWRNPEARRQVVAQIVDYAQAMSSWAYEDLDAAVGKGVIPGAGRSGRALWETVSDAEAVDEAEFVDAVSRNLRLGRMLLLIVGDGIREGVESLAKFLQAHAGIHFTLGIVELPIYALPDGGHVVCPQLVARTVNIERGIVRLADDRIHIVPPMRERRTTISMDRVLEALAKRAPQLVEPLKDLSTALEADDRPLVMEPATKSLQVKWQDPADRRFSLGGFTVNGEFTTSSVCWVPESCGRVDLAHEYLERLATIVGGQVRKTPTPGNWYVVASGTTLPAAGDVLSRQEEWLGAIRDYVSKLQAALEGE